MPKNRFAFRLNPGIFTFFTVMLLLFLLLATAIKNPYFSFAPQAAPDETFTTLGGEKISLKALRGKPVLLTFWASNCAACIKEMPHLIELYHDYHAQGLEIIAVAMSYNPPNYVMEAVKAYQLPYPVALDLNSAHALAFGNVAFTPSTFLIDGKGFIAKKTIGMFNPLTMKTQIETLLKG